LAIDAPANAEEALSAEAISCPIYVDNTPPRLGKRAIKWELDDERRVRVSGYAIDLQSDIAGVEYSIDGGPPATARAEDGIFDSVYERFTFVTQPLQPGTHRIEVAAYDEPRNRTAYTIELEIKAGEREEALPESGQAESEVKSKLPGAPESSQPGVKPKYIYVPSARAQAK